MKKMLDTDHAAGKAHDCIKAYANFAAKGLYHLFWRIRQMGHVSFARETSRHKSIFNGASFVITAIGKETAWSWFGSVFGLWGAQRSLILFKGIASSF